MSTLPLSVVDLSDVVRDFLPGFRTLASKTANTLDDTLFAFLSANEDALFAVIEYLASFLPENDEDPDPDFSRLPLMAIPDALRNAADRSGIKITDLIPFLVKYGPLFFQFIKFARSQG